MSGRIHTESGAHVALSVEADRRQADMAKLRPAPSKHLPLDTFDRAVLASHHNEPGALAMIVLCAAAILTLIIALLGLASSTRPAAFDRVPVACELDIDGHCKNKATT